MRFAEKLGLNRDKITSELRERNIYRIIRTRKKKLKRKMSCANQHGNGWSYMWWDAQLCALTDIKTDIKNESSQKKGKYMSNTTGKPKDNYLTLYADEFDWDIWKQYCEVCGVPYTTNEITIKFSDDDIESRH